MNIQLTTVFQKKSFLETYNFYPYKEHIHKNLDVTVYLTEDHKTKRKFVKNNFLFQCSHSSENNTNRSAKILYEFTEEYTDNYIDSFDFTNLYTNILQFYINIELDQCILKKIKFYMILIKIMYLYLKIHYS